MTPYKYIGGTRREKGGVMCADSEAAASLPPKAGA